MRRGREGRSPCGVAALRRGCRTPRRSRRYMSQSCVDSGEFAEFVM
ncbi:hypothetical protein SLNWT_4567 [Streptomyces albus]|uniref:Uncharacterized protein n=1 Tax=Streptomyces albus (strain ATCC 21838 / DSM 41398 / FERM P-419 / JCM 4703 / NBRC 107858) TaxID=1081613 RepID=A0A0B5EQ99_STRA4|nr:hypothetical protein SLNWT_4567 [Streptomyces albus]